MNEKKIEELLSKSWSPKPSEEMRERVLSRAREELTRESKTWINWLQWKPALVVAVLMIVIYTHVSDAARQSRMSVILNAPNIKASPSARPEGPVRWGYDQVLARSHMQVLLNGCDTGDIMP